MNLLLTCVVFLALMVAGCGVTDFSASDTYSQKLDYSLFSKPMKSSVEDAVSSLQLPNLVKGYDNDKRLYDEHGKVIIHDLYLGSDFGAPKEDYYAVISNCGFDIKAVSIITNITRNVSKCHAFDFGTSVMRDWKSAQSDFLISNGKLIYWKENPWEKKNSYKTKRAWNDHPEIYPKNTLVIIDALTGTRKDSTIEAPTENRERGADFYLFCFSPDLKYFASYFSSNFVHCRTEFNQGEKCDTKNNLVVGSMDDGKVYHLFSGDGVFSEKPNVCSVLWTDNDDLVFKFNENTYLSMNIGG